jgi:hypothetical protein
MDRILTNGKKLLTSKTESVGRVSFNEAYKQYIRTDYTPNICKDDFSIEMMVSCTKASGNNVLMVQGDTTGTVQFWWFGINANRLVFTVNNVTYYSNTVTLTDGVIRHIAMVRSAGVVTFYVNKVSQGTASTAANADSINNILPEVRFGSFGNSNSSFSNATMRYARAWNRALTTSELNENRDRSITGTGLLLEYKMNEGNGTVTRGTLGSTGTLSSYVSNDNMWLTDVAGYEKLLVSRDKQPYMLSFNGTTEYFDTGFGAGLNMANTPISIEFLLKPKASPLSGTHMATGTALGNDQRLYLGFLNGEFRFGVQSIFTGGGSFTINNWYHIAISLSGTQAKLYVNAILVSTLNYTSYILPSNIYVGALNNTLHGNCEISDYKIYNGNRTETQVIGSFRGEPDTAAPIRHYQGRLSAGKVVDSTGYSSPVATSLTSLPSTAPVGQRSGLRLTGSVGNLGNPAAFQGVSTFTVTAWVRIPNDAAGFALINKENNAAFKGFKIYKSGNQLRFGIGKNGTSFTTLDLMLDAYYGKWVHLAFRHNNATLEQSIAVNAVEVVGRTLSAGTYEPAADTMNLIIGSSSNSVSIAANVTWYSAYVSLADIQRDMHRYLPAATPNLIEQWKLNEGVGTTVYGTKGNNGTITGTATWTTPSLMNYVGKQLSLNGTSQYVNTALSLSGSYTKECWINPSSIAGTDNIISGGVTGFSLIDGKLSGGHNGSYQQVSDTVTITGHTHVAITYNGITKLLSLYKNGLLIASATSASYTASVQQVGAFGGANLFHGKLDDPRIWNYARTQTQIQENMNRTLGREAGLVLNMGFESDFYDTSGYGNHGTPVGSPLIEVTDNDKLLLNAPIN